MRKEREKPIRSAERAERPAYQHLNHFHAGVYAHAISLNEDEEYFFEVEDF